MWDLNTMKYNWIRLRDHFTAIIDYEIDSIEYSDQYRRQIMTHITC